MSFANRFVKEVLDLVGGQFQLEQQTRNESISRLGPRLTVFQEFFGDGVSLFAPLLNHLTDSFRRNIEPLHPVSCYSKKLMGTRNQRFERLADLQDGYGNCDEHDGLEK